METTSQQGLDRVTPSSTSTSSAAAAVRGRSVEPDNLKEQPVIPKDERVVSVNPSSKVAISGPSKHVTDRKESLAISGALPSIYPLNTYSSQGPTLYQGYDNNSGYWDEYPQYVNANGLQVLSPAMYNENQSLLFHSGYGFDNQMGYGQFSPLPSPLSPIMVDGQLFSPHQISMSPAYYPQPVSSGVSNVTTGLPTSQAELMTQGNGSQEGFSDNMLFSPGSGYLLHYGSFGGADLSGNTYSPGLYRYPGEFGSGDLLPHQSNSSETSRYLPPMTSASIYPQPIGILGAYEHNAGQISQQERPFQRPGLASTYSTRSFPHGSSYQNSNYGSHWGGVQRNRLLSDKSGRQERDHNSNSISNDGISSDHNRGPRASKQKGKSTAEERYLSFLGKNDGSSSGVNSGVFNRPDFVTNYESAKFFVIKSFSEDNVHKSMKYGVWASTPLGNRKLDAAYQEAKEMKPRCPIFLLFSVNASGQFCGVAEMVGSVDFENDADYWQQDRWSGRFLVQWHIVKDVPNSQFRHILLENNDNKPVTHSRDCQEVKLEQGIEMLKIFKEHDADTSILDDFSFYDEREKVLQERKARQRASSTKNDLVALADSSINQLSDKFSKSIQFQDGKEVSGTE